MIIKKFEVEFDGVKSSISMVAQSEGLEDNIVGASDCKILKSCAIIPDTGQENIMDILVDFLCQTYTFFPKTNAKTTKYTLDCIVEGKEWYFFVEYTDKEIKKQEIIIDGKAKLASINNVILRLCRYWHVLSGRYCLQNVFVDIPKFENKLLLVKWIDYAKHPKILIESLEKYHKLCGFQIIFTTYNVKIMDRRIMRDDQIVLVQNGKTSSLADYEIDKKYIILDNLYLQGAFY